MQAKIKPLEERAWLVMKYSGPGYSIIDAFYDESDFEIVKTTGRNHRLYGEHGFPVGGYVLYKDSPVGAWDVDAEGTHPDGAFHENPPHQYGYYYPMDIVVETVGTVFFGSWSYQDEDVIVAQEHLS